MAEESESRIQNLITTVIQGTSPNSRRQPDKVITHVELEDDDKTDAMEVSGSDKPDIAKEFDEHVLEQVNRELEDAIGYSSSINSHSPGSIHEAANNYDTDVTGTENDLSVLRVDVSQSEMGILDESTVNHDDEFDDRTSSTDGTEISLEEMKETVEPQSILHCSLCGLLFTDPRLLDCLHTFCLQCLEKWAKVKDGDQRKKAVICPECGAMTPFLTTISKTLPSSEVLKHLVECKIQGMDNEGVYCVVCLLHNTKTEPTGQCRDCGDLLCDSCSEKHKFVRQTAKHVIVSLDDENALPQRHLTYCENHPCVLVNMFCNHCQKLVCKDCSVGSCYDHRPVPVEAVKDGMRKALSPGIGDLQEQMEKLNQQSLEETLEMINQKEKEQLEFLHKSRDEIVRLVDQQVEKTAENLKKKFTEFRKTADIRHRCILQREKDVAFFTKTVDFLMNEGKVNEIKVIEPKLKSRLKGIHRLLRFQRVPNIDKLPTVEVEKDNLQKLQSMQFFTVTSPNQKNASSLNKAAQNTIPKTLKKTENKAPGQKPKATQPGRSQHVNNGQLGFSLLVPSLLNPKAAVGRGRVLEMNVPSLLGEYPVAGRGRMMSAGEPLSCVPTGWMSNTGGSYNQYAQPVESNASLLMEDQRFVRFRPAVKANKPALLKLRSSMSIQLPDDKKQPEITDVVFTSAENFVLCDERNKILKAFSCHGKYLDFIKDPGPLSVTFLGGKLIWNSQFTSIKSYDVNTKKISNLLSVSRTANHPLAAFSSEHCQRLLVGNVVKSSIETYTVDGRFVMMLEPRDRMGQMLKNITYIAAYKHDQIVLIDSSTRKVVVNDFDGKCLGEFSKPDMDPSCACIIENGQIFVTDRARDKIILLNANGEFLKEWSTLVHKPNAMATNENGMLVMAGMGELVKIYCYELSYS